jgi:hypothetical protein
MLGSLEGYYHGSILLPTGSKYLYQQCLYMLTYLLMHICLHLYLLIFAYVGYLLIYIYLYLCFLIFAYIAHICLCMLICPLMGYDTSEGVFY